MSNFGDLAPKQWIALAFRLAWRDYGLRLAGIDPGQIMSYRVEPTHVELPPDDEIAAYFRKTYMETRR